MRVFLTGASGFVGSNLQHVFAERHGAEVVAPGHEHVDLTDPAIVRRGVAADEPPAPINTYGFLKASSELVVAHRAQHGTVARIAGVQGVHRARPQAPRAQDAGFGNLVASLVDALRAKRRFTLWNGPRLNLRATPTLATDAAELIWRVVERRVTGILRCCGGEHADRIDLARRAIASFELDPELLEIAPPPAQALLGGGVPRDTRLDAAATAAALGVELPDLDTTLAPLRGELENSGRPA